MKKFFTTNIGRLRLLGILEGVSLLILLFIAVPLKYFAGYSNLVKMLGPIHGALFLLFVFNSVSVGIQERWKFWKTTWKVVISCLIPFGTFYIDLSILAKLHQEKTAKGLLFLIMLIGLVGCSNPPSEHYYKNNIDFPKKLSAFKIFKGPMSQLKPQKNAHLLQLSSILFTDYTEKQRLLILPANTKLVFDGHELPNFPEGTIIAKTFYYSAHQTGEDQKIIETRILKKNAGLWNVATYVWNENQDDADLTYDGATVSVTITNPQGESKDIDYKVPSGEDCFVCHRSAKDLTPIGPKFRNLNRSISIGGTAVPQLEYFQKEGLIDIAARQSVTKLPSYSDKSVPIEQRARAYFEMNCAHCHNSNGFASGFGLDLSYETSYDKTGILTRKTNITHRMTIHDMPKLGTTQVDKEGLKIIQKYMETLKVAPSE